LYPEHFQDAHTFQSTKVTHFILHNSALITGCSYYCYGILYSLQNLLFLCLPLILSVLNSSLERTFYSSPPQNILY